MYKRLTKTFCFAELNGDWTTAIIDTLVELDNIARGESWLLNSYQTLYWTMFLQIIASPEQVVILAPLNVAGLQSAYLKVPLILITSK